MLSPEVIQNKAKKIQIRILDNCGGFRIEENDLFISASDAATWASEQYRELYDAAKKLTKVYFNESPDFIALKQALDNLNKQSI